MTRFIGFTTASAFGLALLTVASGCGEEAPAKPKIKARETLGKKTQDVRELKAELAQGGEATDGKIHSTDYLRFRLDALRTTMATSPRWRSNIASISTRRSTAKSRRLTKNSWKDHQER